MKKNRVKGEAVTGNECRELLHDFLDRFHTVKPEEEDGYVLPDDFFESDISETEDLISLIASETAAKATHNFLVMVDGKEMESIFEMLSLMRIECPIAAILILKGMFLAAGMDHAASDLDIIAICSSYCEDVYDYFFYEFMANDDIDWFAMEETLMEAS